MGEFAIKVSPFGGSTAGKLWEGKMRAFGRGGGVVQTYIGQRVDLYRSSSRPI